MHASTTIAKKAQSTTWDENESQMRIIRYKKWLNKRLIISFFGQFSPFFLYKRD